MSGTITFPPNPTDGQQYTAAGVTWQWSAAKGVWQNANTGANFVPISGGTMTGALVLPGNAPSTAPLQAVPLQQVNSAVAAEVPTTLGRNLLHNSQFVVMQRGSGAWNVSGFTADRWGMYLAGGDALSVQLYSLADADRSQIGDEAALANIGASFTGTNTASSQSVLYQSIEGVNRTAGKTVAVSFWARYSAGTPRLGVGFQQGFGTGGSPSAGVVGNIGVATISGSWARYTMTAAIPSIIGKTRGTNGNDILQLVFYFSCAPTNPNYAASGNLGVQSGSIGLWGVQLEVLQPGAPLVPTALEKLDPVLQLQQCQRFYLTAGGQLWGYGVAGTWLTYHVPFCITMRAVPSIVINGSSTNTTAVTSGGVATFGVVLGGSIIAAGNANWQCTFTASADL